MVWAKHTEVTRRSQIKKLVEYSGWAAFCYWIRNNIGSNSKEIVPTLEDK